MQYHKALKELALFTSRLVFKTTYDMSRASENNGFEVDVKIYKYCNGMSLDSFKLSLENIVEEIFKVQSTEINRKGIEMCEDVLSVIVSLSTLKGNLFKDGKYIGVEVEEPAKKLEEMEAYDIGAMDYNNITDMKETKEDFFRIVADSINELIARLSTALNDLSKDNSIQKLEWNAKPAQLALMLKELESKGWINTPLTNGEVSNPKLAKQCADIFKFNGTERSLRNALDNDFSISDERAAKFTLVDLKDIE